MKTTLGTVVTFAASVVAGCVAAVAIASAAAVSQVAPSIRPRVQTMPADVIRLDPVVVTVSRTYYDAVRATSTEALARSNDARKTTRG
jgi:hypothetical protein